MVHSPHIYQKCEIKQEKSNLIGQRGCRLVLAFFAFVAKMTHKCIENIELVFDLADKLAVT
ncbi:MAG: hypothetical protein COA69_14170 [Robiginitomaculum sp.]|nr:MAG: hypothetical protein COA69_14170 [Robiginitomaculum sp.]